jgi:hypothetical protein
VALDQGRHDDADAILVDAAALYDLSGGLDGQAHVLHTRGEIARRVGDLNSAETFLSSAQAIYDGIGDRVGRANTRHVRGRTYSELARQRISGSSDRQALSLTATSLFKEASDLYLEGGRIDWAGRSLRDLALYVPCVDDRARIGVTAARLLNDSGCKDEAVELTRELGLAAVGEAYVETIQDAGPCLDPH